MTLPAAATKVNLDAATDDPSQARVELVALIDKFNALLTALPTDFLAINGNAASASTSAACSGNAATSSACSGNAASSSSCSGNSTTATTATNSSGTGSIPYTRHENGLRIVRGTVNADGSIAAGSGFTVAKDGTGAYAVLMNNFFSGIMSLGVAATEGGMAGSLGWLSTSVSPWNIAGTGSAHRGFYIQTRLSTATAPADKAFSFIAIGPN